jgi:hypothetical protein
LFINGKRPTTSLVYTRIIPASINQQRRPIFCEHTSHLEYKNTETVVEIIKLMTITTFKSVLKAKNKVTTTGTLAISV